MAKIYLTCPECGCNNWIVRDDEEAEGAFECGACGDLVFTEDMGAEVEEDVSTPAEPLSYAMDMFINAAVNLSDVISASDAEELVSAKYPFNKSFDELIWDMREWKEAVAKEETKS